MGLTDLFLRWRNKSQDTDLWLHPAGPAGSGPPPTLHDEGTVVTRAVLSADYELVSPETPVEPVPVVGTRGRSKPLHLIEITAELEGVVGGKKNLRVELEGIVSGAKTLRSELDGKVGGYRPLLAMMEGEVAGAAIISASLEGIREDAPLYTQVLREDEELLLLI